MIDRRRTITIKDIARELGISTATVSRALRNTYDVSEITRKRVLKKGRELNYRPNFNARGLVNNRSHNIAVILPTITNYYFSTVITGIQSVAFSNDYNIILHSTGESRDRELTIVSKLHLSSIDGLLVCVTSASKDCRHFEEVMDLGIPVVFFDRTAEIEDASKVTQDDFDSAYMAVEHLIHKGYRKIAHIGGPMNLTISRERQNGYLAALKKFNLPFSEEWIIHSGFSQESGMMDTLKLLENKKNRPDAIFAVTDRKAVGAILALKEKRVQIGKEVGVVGFTNDPISAIISPGLTTVEVPALEVGMHSCELLLKHIAKKSFRPKNIVLNGKLIVRESTSR